MSWAFTIYESYGTLQEIVDHCLTRFGKVAVYKETTPYVHYHGMLGQCRKGVNDNYKNTIKFLWKLKKTKNFREGKRMYMCAVHDKQAYFKYISKMNGIECEGWSNFSEFGIQHNEYWEPHTGIVRNWNDNEYGFDTETESETKMATEKQSSGEVSSLVKDTSTDDCTSGRNTPNKSNSPKAKQLFTLFPQGTNAP